MVGGVAVVVAIAVTVAVAVATSCAFCAIENDGKVLEAFVLIDGLQLGEHRAVEQTGTYDEECAVGDFLQYLGVCDDVDGWAVDEYVVVFGAKLLYETL